MKRAGLKAWFTHFAGIAARASGHAFAFLTAFTLIVVWAVTGPIFHFSNTWQLVVNTATTIVTFLMVFLIQHAQNRDSEAVQLKLDELIRAASNANHALLDLEELDDEELDAIRTHYAALARQAQAALRDRAGREKSDLTIGCSPIPPQ
jgi:low affinity Fe/Cu permease